MDFRERLRAEKTEGEREWQTLQSEERERKAAEAARIKQEEDLQRAAEAEKNRKRAEEVFATLPMIVRQTAGKGLKVAVLADSFVDEHPSDEKPSQNVVLNRRTYYLTG